MRGSGRCPLCNGGTFSTEGEFMVCVGCCEMLYPDELVRRATLWTRRRYNRRPTTSHAIGRDGRRHR